MTHKTQPRVNIQTWDCLKACWHLQFSIFTAVAKKIDHRKPKLFSRKNKNKNQLFSMSSLSDNQPNETMSTSLELKKHSCWRGYWSHSNIVQLFWRLNRKQHRRKTLPWWLEKSQKHNIKMHSFALDENRLNTWAGFFTSLCAPNWKHKGCLSLVFFTKKKDTTVPQSNQTGKTQSCFC